MWNTKKKTKTDITLFEEYFYFVTQVKRNIEDIDPAELNTLLSKYFVQATKINGEEYEPSSLNSQMASMSRYDD